jgi:hypothetical protein
MIHALIFLPYDTCIPICRLDDRSNREMTVLNELAEADDNEEVRAWISRLIYAKQAVIDFVANGLVSNTPGESDTCLKEFFNLSIEVKLGDKRKAVI